MFAIYTEKFNLRWAIRSLLKFLASFTINPLKALVIRLAKSLYVVADVASFRLYLFNSRAGVSLSNILPKRVNSFARYITTRKRAVAELVLLLTFFLFLDNFTPPRDLSHGLPTAILWLEISGAFLLLSLLAEFFLWKLPPVHGSSQSIFGIAAFSFVASTTSWGMCLSGHVFTSMFIFTPLSLLLACASWAFVSKYQMKITFTHKPVPQFPQ